MEHDKADSISRIPLTFCITGLYVGGAERAMCELATRLDPKRFDIAVYSLQPRPEDDSRSCVPMLEKAGIPVFFLDMKSPWGFFGACRKLRKLLKERKPTIFLSFLFHANFLGRLAARFAGVEHILCGIRVAERRKGIGRLHLLLDRWTSGCVEKYVCVSNAVAEYSEKVAGIPKNKLVVIPNAVDVDEFRNATPADLTAEEVSPDSKKAIFIGRMDDQKGVDRLLKLAPDWLKSAPEWELLLVGDGPKHCELTDYYLQPFFDKVRYRIHFLGWRKDVPELLAASDLFVLPSRWEGMPNAVLQAMAAGLPIVSTSVEGVQELLGDLAEPQTAEIERFPERLLAVPQIEGLGERNHQRAAEQFSFDVAVSRYAALFETILEKIAPNR